MNEMEEFERELRRALGRVEAPEALVGSVMAAAGEGHPRRVLWFRRPGAWFGNVAASLLVGGLLLGLGVDGVEHHRAVERARAERDFARSLELTDRALAQTRQHLRQAGIMVHE